MQFTTFLMTAAFASAVLGAPAPEPRTRTVVVTATTVVVVDNNGNTINVGKQTPAPATQATQATNTVPTTSISTAAQATGTGNADGPDPMDFYAPLGDDLYPNAQYGVKWARKIVAQHNIHRINHTVGRVHWDAGLAYNAYAWANKCQWEHNNQDASGNWTAGSYGQNMVTAGKGIENPGEDIAEAWYNGEYARYVRCSDNWTREQPRTPTEIDPKDTGEFGHLTQLLWKDTTAIGCALIECGKRPGGLKGVSANTVQNMFVCNYGTPGNWQGQYKLNVPPPSRNFPVVKGDFIADLA